MTGRKNFPQARIRPSLEILEDRLAAGNLLPFLSFMLPLPNIRTVARRSTVRRWRSLPITLSP
jgi:hypothetical protein